MKDEEALTIATGLLHGCANARDDDGLAANRVSSLNYYFMRERGDEVDGRSKVVAGDVSAMTDATMAQIMASFTDANIAAFDPLDEGDIPAAGAESSACLDILMRKNRGYLELQSAIKNAAQCRYGVLKVWGEQGERSRKRIRYNVTPESFAALFERGRGRVEATYLDSKAGTVRVVETYRDDRVRVASVLPENFVFTRNWQHPYLDGIPCCGERHLSTRTEMIETHGFDADKVELCERYTTPNQTALARDPRGVGANYDTGGLTDKSAELVEWFELYAIIDIDGDGIGELCAMSLQSGRVVLEAPEPVDRRPYAIGVLLLNPGRLPGISIFDKVGQIQDKNTALERLAIDNGMAANRPRTAFVEEWVDAGDLEDGRINGNIAVKAAAGDVRAAIAAHIVPDTSAGLLAQMEFQKRNRAELGGASLDLATGQAQLTDRVGSEGLDRAYSVMEILAALQARTFAETLVRDTMLLIHATARETLDELYTFQQGGSSKAFTPRDWPEREHVTVKLGMSPAERRRMAEALWQLLNVLIQLAREGMRDVLVTLPKLYRALVEWARVVSIPVPEAYLLDPESDPARRELQKREASAQQQQQQQQQLMAMALGLEKFRVVLEKSGKEGELVYKYFKAILDSKTAVAQTVGKAATDFELQARQAADAADQSNREKETADAVKGAAIEVQKLDDGGDDDAAE